MTTWPLTGPEASGAWVDRYLAVLGVDPDAPSPGTLGELTRAHLLAVVFENVTSLLRRGSQPAGPVPPPDAEAMLGNWERRQGGGVCFEIAPMFGRLLGALGYRASLVMAQISFPGGHHAVRVDLDGGSYLVDVGCGAPLFEPIPLDRVVEVRRAGLAYRFRQGEADDEWVQDRWIDGAWAPFCRYDLRPPVEREREAAYQRHHTPGESWVVDRPRLVRCEADAVLSLNGEEFTRFTDGGKRAERIGDPGEYARLATEIFRLPALPILEGFRARSEMVGAAADD